MANEAKFSVILPAASFSKSRIEEFEKEALHYNLPVTLPLQTDSNDNTIVASGLSLRDAQLLRRKVAECGYTVDVVSDAAQRASDLFKDGDSNTQVLGEQLMQAAESVGDISSEAWDNLEMPNLDLGLSDGAEVEDWHAVSASERTQSVSLFELLQAAQSAQSEPEDNYVPSSDSFSPNVNSLNKVLSEKLAQNSANQMPSSANSLEAVNRSDNPTPKPMDAVNPNAFSADNASASEAAAEIANASEAASEIADAADDKQTAETPDADSEEAFDENATKSISSEKVEEILKTISQESETRPMKMPPPRELDASGDFPISVACMNIPTNDAPQAATPAPAASSAGKSQTSGLRVFVIATIIVIIIIAIVVGAAIVFDIKPILELVTKPLF